MLLVGAEFVSHDQIPEKYKPISMHFAYHLLFTASGHATVRFNFDNVSENWSFLPAVYVLCTIVNKLKMSMSKLYLERL